MNVAIVGYGKQGQSSSLYWTQAGHTVTVCDANSTITVPDGVEAQLGAHYLENLSQFDLIVRAPVIHPNTLLEIDPELGSKITSNTNEFLRVCPTKNIIGVTGTKGKGTTSTLITEMLKAAGYRVHLGGNIGTPPLDLLQDNIQPDDWVVLELANFQLIDLRYSPHIAVCLLVADEHLDWHGGSEEYHSAKRQLFAHQTSTDFTVYYADNVNSQNITAQTKARRIPYFAPPGALVEADSVVIDGKRVCDVSEIKLLGKHNWQNVCAAVTAVWQITHDTGAIRQAIQQFSGLPYRIEKIREKDGVLFFNDSFSTNPHATKAAVEAIHGPKTMILGGYDRGLDLSELCQLIADPKNSVKNTVVIGASGDRLSQALADVGVHNVHQLNTTSITDITKQSFRLSEPGYSVVFSPGFASFDMFKNFEDRGQQFSQAVAEL
jgi:UDP-N-acetylmuramoylalanine--D-glutamate ligase